MITTIASDEADLINKLMSLIEQFSNKAIEDNGVFNVGLSGGSLIKFLSQGLPKLRTDFSKWRVFFCDERVVPEDDPESTFGMYKTELLDKIPIKEEQFVKIKQGVSAEDAAADYVHQMEEYFPGGKLPKFDLLLLGLGPDGHTCSLFPDHPLLEEKSKWIGFITDSPKPPPSRITMTFPVINSAKCCIFSCAGEGKAEMVKRVLEDKEDFPATRVKPTAGFLYWVLDKAAAKQLKQ